MRIVALLAVVVIAVVTTRADARSDFARWVDPFIGTGAHGHTFPGAVTPFGMVQLSPDTRIDGSWDGCSGYHHDDHLIYGFSHTHLSGTGCSDWGDIMLMPYVADSLAWEPKDYASPFLHESEQASPGYYAVTLEKSDVGVELTVTPRVGLHRYTFHRGGRARVVLDLNHRDKLLDGMIHVVSPTRVVGYRRSEAWAKDQLVCYVIDFSKPIAKATFRTENGIEENVLAREGTKLACNFEFDVKKGESLLVKVALSPVRVEGAEKNLDAELPGWDFDATRTRARDLWNRELGKIEVTGGSKDQRTIFYTALYHCMIHPSLAMDVDGSYLGRDFKPHVANGFTYYTVFSLWDTFRALHPLLTIIDERRTRDFIRTFLAQYEQGGRLPVWELSSNETDTMIGHHAIPVIADAVVDGLDGFDANEAFEAMVASANKDRPGLRAYIEKGVIETDDDAESVSKTLEYAFDDWCIALVAQRLGRGDDVARYFKRSRQWKNVFDSATGFMRPRQNGGWLTPFDPREVNNHFTEANSWQYSFFVPQDLPGLIAELGGRDALDRKLDELFSETNQTTGREQADISGLIGQYAHGNEPSHDVACLYNAAGRTGKAQDRIRQILSTLYDSTPGGLCGNDDCGQMSAWYVFGAIGIYPTPPAGPFYQLGIPIFDAVDVHLENGRTFSIRFDGKARRYVTGARVGERTLEGTWLARTDVKAGHTLRLKTADRPDPAWGREEEPEILHGPDVVPSPLVGDNRRTFRDRVIVDFLPAAGAIHFTTDGSVPTGESPVFHEPFTITETTTVRAIAVSNSGDTSFTTTAYYHRIPNNWTIAIHSTVNHQYTAGGDDGIIDGLRGDIEWRKGGWQGYQGQDFEAVVDLGREQDVHLLGAGFLQDTRSWILMPKRVVFALSTDGKAFRDVVTVDSPIGPDDYKVQIRDFAGVIDPTKTRYVRVRAENFGTLPAWHAGAGDQAFIFIDEITIR